MSNNPRSETMLPATNRSWGFIGYSALLGLLFPSIIVVTSLIPGVSDIWWWHNIILLFWPTFPPMLAFSGASFDYQTALALTMLSALNAVVYAIVAYALTVTFQLWQRWFT